MTLHNVAVQAFKNVETSLGLQPRYYIEVQGTFSFNGVAEINLNTQSCS